MKKQVNLIKVYNLLGDKQPQKKKYTFTYDPNLFGLNKPKNDSKSEQNKQGSDEKNQNDKDDSNQHHSKNKVKKSYMNLE